MKRLIVDLDDTITISKGADYSNAKPNKKMVSKLLEYQKKGFDIVIHTSRNMRTYNGNIGYINLNTIPVITDWLKKNNVPCNELFVGKPWCGEDGFYIDDKAIRPKEFLELSEKKINELINGK